MNLNSIFQFLVPKDKKFYPLLKTASDKLIFLAETLHEVEDLPKKKREDHFDLIGKTKTEIEELAQETRLELSRNFITPFDREDIYSLITAISDVADYMDESASRIYIYQVGKIIKSIKKLAKHNLDACIEIGRAIEALKDMNDLETVSTSCDTIKTLEQKADRIFDNAILDIFENEDDIKNIIKYKEVLTSLEIASDKCRIVANILEGIVVKYS